MAETEIAVIERLARIVCMEQYGGYPVDRQERESWPTWQRAKALVVRLLDDLHAHHRDDAK